MVTKSEKTEGGLKVITTDDGSHSIYNETLDEVYHSTNGALAESEHVFIKAGFDNAAKRNKEIHLLEVGFGSGLNALLTALNCYKGSDTVWYEALEPFPLEPKLIQKLNYPALLPEPATAIWSKLHSTSRKNWMAIHEKFQFLLINDGLEEFLPPQDHYNLVYFDAFAPTIQPALWAIDIFRKLYSSLKDGGILVTYSAKGEVRRNLIKAGFIVERLPGPAGKREMLRAIKKPSG